MISLNDFFIEGEEYVIVPRMRFVPVVASGVIILGILFFLGWWSAETLERPRITIEAAHDVPENGLPVYAQFVVTQQLHQVEMARISSVHVPVYWPVAGAELQIDLQRNGIVLQSWREGGPSVQGMTEVVLPLLPARLLDGDLELSFSSRQVTHADKNEAPRIFVESADANYPGGNYRIAQNEKQGDVALTMYEIIPRWRVWQEELSARPLSALFHGLVGMAFIFLLSSIPFLFSREVSGREGNDQTRSERPATDDQG